MTGREPLWITEADVVHLMHLGDAIDALESGLAEQALGSAHNMEKTAAHWGASSNMHAIGAVFAHAGLFGTKTWGHTPVGSTPLLIVWDAETGRLRAIIEASALGQMRTGSMSGVATRWMSDPAGDDLAVIGSGKQAITQVAAVAAVRRLRRIRVYSPTLAKRAEFGSRLGQIFPSAEVVIAADVTKAVEGASIITLITRATEPFLEEAMVARGAHVNAVGAITRERKEFTSGIFLRAGLVVVDTLAATQKLSAEFCNWYDEKRGGDWSEVRSISDLVANAKQRPMGLDLSLFKAMGMGVSDLALGIEVIKRAEESGRGRAFPHPEPIPPRLTQARQTEKEAAI